MGAVRYVIVSTPRSGTRYSARLLTAMGLDCTHEGLFTPQSQTFTDNSRAIFGDSSWMAAPFLNRLPAETVIFHQVRDPAETINSLIHTGHFGFRELEENPYLSFLRSHMKFRADDLSEQDLAVEFWCSWHEIIEERARGHQYVRFKLEEMSVKMLQQMAAAISVNVERTRILKALFMVPKDCNTRGTPRALVTPDTLPSDVRELAGRYGYVYS